MRVSGLVVGGLGGGSGYWQWTSVAGLLALFYCGAACCLVLAAYCCLLLLLLLYNSDSRILNMELIVRPCVVAPAKVWLETDCESISCFEGVEGGYW